MHYTRHVMPDSCRHSIITANVEIEPCVEDFAKTPLLNEVSFKKKAPYSSIGITHKKDACLTHSPAPRHVLPCSDTKRRSAYKVKVTRADKETYLTSMLNKGPV